MLYMLIALLLGSGVLLGWHLKAVRVETKEVNLDERLAPYHR